MLAAVPLWLLTAMVAVAQPTGLPLRPVRQAVRSCNSPTEDCVLLNSCPKLQSLIHPPTRAGILRVQRLRCGTQNNRLLVCCPTDRLVVTQTTPHSSFPPATALSSEEALLPRSCGHFKPGSKIVGGTPVDLGEYPWMAVLGFQRRSGSDPIFWGCGGSLINERYVLTAAHCTIYRMTNFMDLTTVRLGENNLETPLDCRGQGFRRICAPAVLDFSPSEIVRHPDFNTRGTLSDDVALIRLDRAVQFSTFIQPVCLPAPGDTFSGIVGDRDPVVIGFGDTETGLRSLQLLQVVLPVVPSEQCRAVANYNTSMVTGPGQVCLGGQFQKDSCVKDSGGPAMVTKTPVGPPFVQVALVSYGTRSCGKESIPAIYTDVASYRRWIVDNLRA